MPDQFPTPTAKIKLETKPNDTPLSCVAIAPPNRLNAIERGEHNLRMSATATGFSSVLLQSYRTAASGSHLISSAP
jgi:hypothetical protein